MASQTDGADARFKEADYRVRLFLSVDLSGSTAFKNSSKGEDRSGGATPKWVTVFEQFYSDFPAQLKTQHDREKNGKSGNDSCPMLWKAVGDELVFCSRVTNKTSIATALNAFISTIYAYRKILAGEDAGLDVKGAAWLAAFPEPNRAVQLRAAELLSASEALERAADDKPFDYDFLGKAIDTGFRVASAAKPEKFVLSVQLARLLIERATNIGFAHSIRFGHPFHLKGVNKGEPYPSLYIDTMEHLRFAEVRQKERTLLNGNISTDTSAIADYLTSYCKTVGTDEIALPDDAVSGVVSAPQSYLDHRSHIAHHLKQEQGRETQDQSHDTDGSKDLEFTEDLEPLEDSSA